jgi:S-(hydroxymethyl)glutathione dehydrogenase / alcohol dehydrogenase
VLKHQHAKFYFMLSISTTRAAILVEQNQSLVVDEITLPDVLDVGQVLVQVKYTGICGAQLGEIAGAKGEDRYLPHLLGHEGGAVVLEVGPGVEHVVAGDHVVMHWRVGLGINAKPAKYTWRGEQLNAGNITTFNQHAVVSENRLTAVPKSLDLAEAAMFGCAVTTGLGVVTNDAKLKLGESIVVIGAGGVGLNITQGAALGGAYPIVAVDLSEEKLELAKTFGATHIVHSSPELDMPEAVKRIVCEVQKATCSAGDVVCHGQADVVVDNTGIAKIIEQAYELTGASGRTILVGVPRHDEKISLHTLPLHFGKVLTGSHGGSTEPAADIPRYLKLVAAGKLNIDKLITHRYMLDQINEALNDMRVGKVVGRCVVNLGSQ